MSEAQTSSYVFDLDGSLDDIPDLPSFKAFPTGAYVVNLPDGVTFKPAEDKKPPTFHTKFELKEIMELKPENLDEGEEPPAIGDVSTMMFQMDNETGAGFFKKFSDPIAEALGTRGFRDLMRQSKGIDLLVAFKRIPGKGENKDKLYQQVLNVEVV